MRRGRGTAAAMTLALAASFAGCDTPVTDDESDSEPPGYEVQIPAGFEPAPPARVARLQQTVDAGAAEADVPEVVVKVHELHLGVIDGSPVELDIQTEDTADGVDVELYDELSRETLDAFPSVEIGETTGYAEFDGDESTVVDIAEGPNGPTSRVASAIHDGFAFNVTLYGPTAVVTGPGDAVLRRVVESWRWED